MGFLPVLAVNINIFRSFHEEKRPTQHNPWFIQKFRYGQVSLRKSRQFQTARQSQVIKTGINCYHSFKKECFRFCQKKKMSDVRRASYGKRKLLDSVRKFSDSVKKVSDGVRRVLDSVRKVSDDIGKMSRGCQEGFR